MEDENILEKLLIWLPPVVLALFLLNHSDFLTRNWTVVFPVVMVGGLLAIIRFLPEVWNQLKGAIPILIILFLIVTGILFAVFGGGADTMVEFSGKAREREINAMR